MTKLVAIADRIATVIAETVSIGDDFFRNHIDVKNYFNPSDERQFLALTAKDETGVGQQHRLTELLDLLDVLADSVTCGDDSRYATEGCRTLFPNDSRLHGMLANHMKRFRTLLIEAREVVEALPDKQPGETLLVVDTNSLIQSPAFDQWQFADIPSFTIIVPSTVLGELDLLRDNNNKTDSVREKCKKIIRQFRGYRQRGDLNKGVPISGGGKVSLVLVPLEPKFDSLPNWLDKDVNDDRILARALMTILDRPKCAVALVSGDINVQNKADHARIEVLQPPATVAAISEGT